MRKKIFTERIWFCILVGLIFIYGIIFPGVTYLNVDYVALVLVIITLFGAVIEKKMEFDIALLFLFQAMFICSLKDDMAGNKYDVCYGWILVSAYIIGKMAIGNLQENVVKKTIVAYFSLALGLFITGILDIIYNISIGYFDTEWIISIWSNETVGRTVYELYGILMVTAIPYFIIQIRNQKKIAILGLVFALIYVFLMVRNEGRYCLFILLLLAPLMFCVYVYDKWNFLSLKSKNLVKGIVSCFIITLIVIALLFKFNICGLKDLYKESYLSGGGGILHNIRFELAKEALKRMPHHLQGGYGNGLKFNAHNTWLEFGDKYGVIVFILLECFRIIIIVDAMKVFLKREYGTIRYLLIPSFCFINIYYSMEPIGFRRRLYFAILLIMFGIVKRLYEVYEGKYT